MERSAIRVSHRRAGVPDFASLHRGYRRAGAASMLAQELVSRFGRPDHGMPAVAMLAYRKTAVDRILPHRQPRTGGAPCVDHVGVAARLAGEPFQQIENQ